MKIEKNSRQMPKPARGGITTEKNYCDLLYAWFQCNSEKSSFKGGPRRISKTDIKWTKIERDFTRISIEGTEEKVMTRKTIKKYFDFLVNSGLIEEGPDGYYYLTTLDNYEANLIEYNTLSVLMNTLQKRSISIYIYLFNLYYANDCEPFVATLTNIKEHIGVSPNTTGNNLMITDTIEILEKLGLLKTTYVQDGLKSHIQFLWVKNKLD